MKRVRMWLRELSLTQQLTTIVFLVAAMFALFVFAILAPQINDFTGNELYTMLENSQETLTYVLNSHPDELPVLSEESSSEISHAVFSEDGMQVEWLSSTAASDDFVQEVQKKILVNEAEGRHAYVVKNGRFRNATTILYSIVELKDGRYLVSLVPSAYETQFRGMLVNNIVNLNVIVAMILFIILTLWVASLIYPLNQIKNYITKIKNDEPAVLTVHRKDEIGEVADALRDMEQELQKQNREKQEMIQNISHDLKTPIATIRSYSESIKDGIYPYGTLEQSVDVIIEHADRLDKKVRSLIALNKMGYLLDTTAEGDNLNMNEVVDKVLLSLKVIRPEITFERQMECKVFFHGEEDPWRIVVENLVDNALRYADSKIIIRLSPGELCVINDGRPIDDEHLKKLFRPYEKGTDGQFGLGLSIVYRIATTYGYRVEADNIQGGVMFRIWKDLPKKELKAIQKERRKEEKEKQKNA